MLVDANNERVDEISKKVFGKPASELKYIMVTNYVHKQLIDGENMLRTGLYSWLPVFNSTAIDFQSLEDKESLKEYDIIHINLSGQDMHLVGEIREILGDNTNNTKIVVNNDYTVELWQASFDYLSTIRRELQYADVVFGTEPYQVGALEVMLGRKVHLIVHPCFVKRLKTLTRQEHKNIISTVWHRYDNYSIPPSLASKGLGRTTRLIGYDANMDKKRFVTSCHYNQTCQATNYLDFCEQLLESEVVIDPFTLTSQSRTGWDCAALGVPLVGSNRNESVRRCFPFTMCDPFDIKEMRRLTKKLLDDKEFRQKVIEHAQKEVECVNYENSKYNLLKAIEEGSSKIEI
jgi:hypothetical protein